MALMTLEEAIDHATFVAATCACEECGTEHLQIAEWLTELKTRREAERENKDKILILKLADGQSYFWQTPDFDEYDVKGRFFVVLKDDHWIAMYAIDQIVAMEVTETG